MNVDFFGNSVRAESEGLMICLTDLARAGNKWRANNGMPIRTLQVIVESPGFIEFTKLVQADLGDVVLRVEGRGRSTRTMGHLYLAIYVAEQYSPHFHYQVIKTFVEGKLLEFRELGGTEFRTLNTHIDQYLPGRELKKSNQGVFIQVAKHIRAKLLGPDATSEDWAKASVSQIHSRYDYEKRLSDYLKQGFVRDYDHLIELVDRL